MNHVEVKRLREEGYTLKAIGDRFGVTRERVRQVLVENYGNTNIATMITRKALAEMLGRSDGTIVKHEMDGLITPIRRGGVFYLYNRSDIEDIKEKIDRSNARLPDVELICEICGAKFYRRPYMIRPKSPGRFCGGKCRSAYLGRNYGFGVHKKCGYKRKWDYNKVYNLQDNNGWGALRISRALNIPQGTISEILRKRKTMDAGVHN